MQVRGIMTRDVISAAPDASALDVASLLVHHHISAVRVTDGDFTRVLSTPASGYL